MTTTRRQFIKGSAAAVTVGLITPKLSLAHGIRQSDANRRILVVIQLAGGNDGLNTVIPYADSRYRSLRPNLSFKESELRDSDNRQTIISNEFGLHPALGEIKNLYDQGKVAIVLGVGYPGPNLSHFLSMDIWHTAKLDAAAGEGW